MPPKLTFEKAMAQLEAIVQELESGDLPLEKALKKFEEGVKLSRYCEGKLDETEARIVHLTQDSDDSAGTAEAPAAPDLPLPGDP